MLSYIRGTLEYIDENKIIIENNGIGYNVLVSPLTISKLPSRGDLVQIYTYMNVREDAISLFGFLSLDEINMFNLLLSVSGVGPKVALSILGTLEPGQISLAIITDDIKSLSSGQGVGKKTAQRIVLELKDKIKTEDAIDTSLSDNISSGLAADAVGQSEKADALEALLALGFSRSEAIKAMNRVYKENMNSGEIISLALKNMNK